MEWLNKVNQDSKLLKKAYKKKAQQSQVLGAQAAQHTKALATKAKTLTKDRDTKATKVGKNHSERRWQIAVKQLKLQCKLLLQEKLDIDILFNMESDNEWLDSPPHIILSHYI